MFSNILFAHDGTACSDLAFDYAIGLAKRLDSKLTVCHANNYAVATYAAAGPVVLDIGPILDIIDQQGRAVAEHAREHARACGVEITVREIADLPSRGIAVVAKDVGADLVILGRHGKGLFERLVDPSVSSQVLHDVHVPLLIIPHDSAACD